MFLRRITDIIELGWVLLKGKLFGISFIVGFLRNPNPRITARLLKIYGAKVGKRTVIKRSVFIDNSYEDVNSTKDFSNIIIGENCYVGDCVYFDLANRVIIEDNAVISGKVSFVTHADCNRSDYLNKQFPRTTFPVRVKKGAWVGFGSCLLTGAVVEENSVVAAFSLLRDTTQPKTLNAGIPSRKLKDI